MYLRLNNLITDFLPNLFIRQLIHYREKSVFFSPPPPKSHFGQRRYRTQQKKGSVPKTTKTNARRQYLKLGIFSPFGCFSLFGARYTQDSTEAMQRIPYF
jgi:hypothetical protein